MDITWSSTGRLLAVLATAGAWFAGVGAARGDLIFDLGATKVQNGGDDVNPVDVSLPWSFTFYGTARSTVRVGSNGGFGLTTAAPSGTQYDGSPWYSTGSGKPMLALLWDDLNTAPSGAANTGVYGGSAVVNGVTYPNAYALTVPAAYTYGSGHASTREISFQVALFSAATVVTLANGDRFSFQSGDVMFCYANNTLVSFADGQCAVGICDGSGNYAGMPGTTAGVLTSANRGLLPTSAGSFVLYRPVDAATYTATIEQFAPPPSAPDMLVQGNGTSIADGDSSPSLADHTDFGAALVDGGSSDRTFTILNNGAGALNLTGSPVVSVAGAHAADFTVTVDPTTPVAGSGSTTFTVHFDPGAEGLRSATLSIDNNDTTKNPYNFAIQGTGTAPAPAMAVRGNGTTIADGDNTPAKADHTDFGTVAMDGATLDRTFTVTNTGTATLNLTGTPLVSIGGAAADDFTVTVDPASTVGVAGHTTFTVHFDPSAEGLRSAAVSIASDDTGTTPYEFAIQGTGYRRNLVFPAAPPGRDAIWTAPTDDGQATRTLPFTFTFYGTAHTDIKITPNGVVGWAPAGDSYGTIASAGGQAAIGALWADLIVRNGPGSGCGVYAASRGSSYSVTWTNVYCYNDGIGYGHDSDPDYSQWLRMQVTLFGAATNVMREDGNRFSFQANDIALSYDLVGFPAGTVDVGIKDGAGNYRGVPDGGGGYVTQVNGTTKTLLPTTGGTFILFRPVDATTYTSTVEQFAPPPVVPDMVVRGNGLAIADGDAVPSLSDHTDFGEVLRDGGTRDRVFTIANNGEADLSLTDDPKVAITGTGAADFSVTVEPGSPVAGSGSTTFTVHFDPSATGLRSATLSIANNDTARNPYDFAVQGTGTLPAPVMVVRGNGAAIADGDATPSLPDHTDFGVVALDDATVVRTFTVTNAGTADVNLTGPTRVIVSGANAADFEVTAQPAAVVPAGGSTTFTVRFDPSALGVRSATLSIANDDSARNPYDFAIQGTGYRSNLIFPARPAGAEKVWTDNGGVVDDAAATKALPFTFNFYGVDRTDVTISANGAVGWGAWTGSEYGTVADSGGKAVIAGLWADIMMHARGGVDYPGVYVASQGTAYTITWSNCYVYAAADGGYERDNDPDFSRWDRMQIALFSGYAEMKRANGNRFRFQAGDIALSYDIVGFQGAGVNVNVGIANGSGLSQGIPNGSGGYVTQVSATTKSLLPTTGDAFILFRKTGAATYEARLAQFAPPPPGTMLVFR